MADITKTRLGNYSVAFTPPSGSAADLGYVDKITPNLKPKFKEIKVGSVGDVVLGRRFIALEGNVQVEFREIDLALFRKLHPWYTSGSVSLFPTVKNKDLYDYAGLLRLHPTDITGATEDLCLVKAAPVGAYMTRDGNADDKLTVEYEIFPDRAQLPTLVFGYMGDPPT